MSSQSFQNDGHDEETTRDDGPSDTLHIQPPDPVLPYVYSPLSNSRSYRLFILHPSYDPVEPVQGHLVEQGADGHSQEYEALSYTWGSSGNDTIRVDNRHHVVRTRLVDALRCLRYKDKDRVLWVDAICINMYSLSERSQQVIQMRHIFQNAREVQVWLGKEDRDSRVAMELIRRIPDMVDRDDIVQGNDSMNFWRSLGSLMKRDYFSRVWVIQEIAVARKVILHAGDDFVDWHWFKEAVNLFQQRAKNTTNESQQTGEVQAWGASRLVQTIGKVFRRNTLGDLQEPLLSLEALVTQLSQFNATDSRDIIYALLGLAKDTKTWSTTLPEGRNNGQYLPDYTKVFSEVCKDFVKFCVTESGSLDLLCRAWISDALAAQVPAWMWSAGRHPFALSNGIYGPNMVRCNADSLVGLAGDHPLYNASGSRIAKVSFGNGRFGDDLSVEGVLIDVVDKITPPAIDGKIPSEWVQLKFDAEKRYPDSFWRTLVANRDSSGHVAPSRWAFHVEEMIRHSDKLGGTSIYNRPATMAGLPLAIKIVLQRIQKVIWNRTLATSRTKRLLVLTPETVQPGDYLCILYGCSVPVVLRKTFTGDKFYILGECYIHGLMDGEAFSLNTFDIKERYQPRKFVLSGERLEPADTHDQSLYLGDDRYQTDESGPWKSHTSPLLEKTEHFEILASPASQMEAKSAVTDLATEASTAQNTILRTFRLHWTCPCGYMSSDNYIEYTPGTINNLAAQFRANGFDIIVESIGMADHQSFLVTFRQFISQFQVFVRDNLMIKSQVEPLPIVSKSKFGGHSSGSSLTVVSVPTTTTISSSSSSIPSFVEGTASSFNTSLQPLESSPGQSSPAIPLSVGPRSTIQAGMQSSGAVINILQDYILLCVKDGELWQRQDVDVTELYRGQTGNLKDQEMFDRLRVSYYKTISFPQRCLSFKVVKKIYFFKFNLCPGSEVDKPVRDLSPVIEYLSLRPPVGPNILAHRFLDRGNTRCNVDWLFPKIPKRIERSPRYDEIPDLDTAWGLQIVEGYSAIWIVLVSLMLPVSSLILGVVGAVVFKSIQDWFGIASWILGVEALAIATLQVVMYLEIL